MLVFMNYYYYTEAGIGGRLRDATLAVFSYVNFKHSCFVWTSGLKCGLSKIIYRSRKNYFWESVDMKYYAEAVLKSAKLNTASATTWSVCSRAKPTAHTGFSILD
jgi:hypothetical protein